MATSSAGSITRWIGQLKAGEREAFEKLFERYFERLVGLARRQLTRRGARRRAADEQDIALSAMDSFYRGVERERFDQLKDRDNLWPLLVVITVRKAIDLVEYEKRRQPRGGRVHGESLFEGEFGLDRFLREDPTPESIVMVADQCQRLLDQLSDETLCQVALLRLEGHTRDEIAEQLGCARRTIARKLALIRKTWSAELPR